MKKLMDWLVKNILVILVTVAIMLIAIVAIIRDPKISTNQKVDMIADHLEIRFIWVEPVEGYWRIVKSGTTKMPDMSVMSNNGFITIPPNVTFDFTGSFGSKQITVDNDSDDLNSYNINFEIDEEMLREKILNIPGVSSVHIRGNYEIMVWKGKAWDWDKDKIHSRIVDVIVSQ